jgi:hypothetical protein
MDLQQRQQLLEDVRRVVGERVHAFAFVAVVDVSEHRPPNTPPTAVIGIYHDPMFGGQLIRGALDSYTENLIQTVQLNDDEDED